MRRLHRCVIASDCQDQLDELQDVVINAKHDQQVKDHVTDGGISFVNLSNEQLLQDFFDVVIVEDQWSVASRILKSISQCDDVDNVLIVNNTSAMELVFASGLPDPAVITLDFLLEGDANGPEEQLLRAFDTTGELYRRIKEIWPLSCVMGISAWVIDNDGNPNSLTAPLVDLIRSNGDNVYPKSGQLWSFLIHLIRNALSIYRIRAEKRAVSQKLDISTRLRNYEFSKYTQQLLAGIDDVLLEIAKDINPYFLWLRGVHENFPPSLRQFFVTGLLIEGEPGSGKTVLCEAVAKAFESEETILPKDLGPDAHPRGWKRRLDQLLTTFYSRARTSRVVVIRADDLVWRRTGEMEAAMANEWERYMRTVRDYIADAARINSGQQPLSEGLRDLHFGGKVLWLFARNLNDDVGEMFAPLKNYLLTVRIEFPTDLEERKKVLVMHASNYGWHFKPDALNLAVKTLSGYTGRDLVGDENSRKGFLTFAINEAKEREQRLFEEHQDESKINYAITVDIVNDWLRSQEHQTILKSTGTNNLYGGEGESPWQGSDMAQGTIANDPNEYSQMKLSKSERIRLGTDMQIMDQIEKCLAEGKSLKEIGQEVFDAERNPTRRVQTYLDTDGPAKVLHAVTEKSAKQRWPRFIAVVAGRKAIHRDYPNKYPDYAKAAY